MQVVKLRFIAGSGRSGTTWVQDALASANRLRPIFEPLHPYVSDMGNRYAHRALTRNDENPELDRFLRDVCAGRSNRFWTQYRQQARWLFPPPAEFQSYNDLGRVWRHWRKFFRDVPRLMFAPSGREPIIKCIRANLMLGWLSARCGYRIVLIVRHPGAVIESELRGSWNARVALDRFRNDDKLHEITGGRYRSLLDRNPTSVEALATRWIIENQWVVEQAPANGVAVVYYERLKAFPHREWQVITHALELEHAPTPRIVARPSQQSSPTRSTATSAVSEGPRWQRILSREQIERIQGTLDLARCDLYSMSDPEPRSPTLRMAGEARNRQAP